MPNKKAPYRTLRAWREHTFYKQQDAAAFLEMSPSYYSRIERGLQSPRPLVAKAISQKTGVSLETLLGIA
jgi:transcriptional regulator with XRE-family HTH domain